MLQFGIDLGGTKTEIIVLDPQGNPLLRERTTTPTHSYDAIVANIAAMVESAASRLSCNDFSLGIGIPGAVSPASGLINANTTCLIGRDLQGDLQHLCCNARWYWPTTPTVLPCPKPGDRQRRFCLGVCGDYRHRLCGGWVINGRLLSGPNAIAGEWGHNPLMW